MPTEFAVAYAPGVTPGKWTRVWEQRHTGIPLRLLPADDAAIPQLLERGLASAALARLPMPGEGWQVISLYRERTVVVAARGSSFVELEQVTAGDLVAATVLPGQSTDTLDLVAAGAGVALLPHSVARAAGRRDVITRPLATADTTAVGLVWSAAARSDSAERLLQEFIGIVRGRTAHSSRGTAEQNATTTSAASAPTRKGSRTSSRSRGRRGGRGTGQA